MSTTSILTTEQQSTTFEIDYARELNSAQLDAVSSLSGTLLVIAGAGTGKTSTLVYRVARLIEEGVAPKHILLLTFTRRAAEEMIHRVATLLGPRAHDIVGGTFHSVSAMLLRRYAPVLGLDRNFTILDRGDAEDTIHFLRTKLDLPEEQTPPFPKKSTIAELFSRAVNISQTLRTVIEQEEPKLLCYLPLLAQLQQDYIVYKREHNLVDYDDLLTSVITLLLEHPTIRARVQESATHICVDEFQDVNSLQCQWIHLVAGPNPNLMVVGDDAQSIYAFRGASVRHIWDFPRWYQETKIVTLEQNYRSTPEILRLANAVMALAPQGYKKNLRATKPAGPKPQLIQMADDYMQADYVLNQILTLHRQGTPLRQIAVLVRNSEQAFQLELHLNRAQLPFIKRGGLQFTESAHIKDLLAHLRLTSNPDDRISWNRSLQLLKGVGPKAAQNLLNAFDNREPLTVLREDGPRTSRQHLKQLADVVEHLQQLHSQNPSLAWQTLVDYYRPICEEAYQDAHKRLRDLDTLGTLLPRYASITDFLTDVTLDPQQPQANQTNDQDRLVISTIHSAKGLEWDAVFVIGAVDGKFPSSQTPEGTDEFEDERRLMYVALTRARKTLTVTYPINIYDKYSHSNLMHPSRFLPTDPTLIDWK